MTTLLSNVTEGDVRTATAADRLAAARAYIERNFHRVPTLEEVAAAAQLSPFHFHRLFRRAYGQTPKQVATSLQVAEAQRLLLRGAAVAEAAAAAGFAHQSHMTARFKRVVGTTPYKWKRATRSARLAG